MGEDCFLRLLKRGKLVRHERVWYYRGSVRNCTRDEGQPPGAGLQEQASNRLSASSSLLVSLSWAVWEKSFPCNSNKLLVDPMMAGWGVGQSGVNELSS
jgi:hypothetical protein